MRLFLNRQGAAVGSLMLVGMLLFISGTLISLQESSEMSETTITASKDRRSVAASSSSRSEGIQATRTSSTKRKTSTPVRRVVHLDLKGAPPKVSYFSQLFPLIKKAGGTALLIEYEDTFPYSDSLEEISAANSYSREDVRKILDLAHQSELQVIPLVQTFGHLEHVLKLEKFAHLREDPNYPESVCPSRNQSVELVKEMLDQVISEHARHPSFSGQIHIGCDEVFHLATCSECASRLRRINSGVVGTGNKKGPRHIFLEHVKTVANYVRQAHGATPLIWDDMLRNIPSWELVDSGIGQLVEPVVWVYGESVDTFVGGHVWHKYASAFGGRLWAASAFKGAFGERLTLPVAHRHLRNNLEWTQTMWREGRASGSANGRHRAGFRGLILTGWSRYDHFAVLCELLPTSVPSLMIDLISVSHPHSERDKESAWRQVMGCPNGTDFKRMTSLLSRDETGRFHEATSECTFPGRDVLVMILDLARIRANLGRLDNIGGWTSDYNFRHNFTSTWRMREPASVERRAADNLASLAAKAKAVLTQIYDNYTVSEWLEQNVEPLRRYLEDSVSKMDRMMARKVWPRRPIQ